MRHEFDTACGVFKGNIMHQANFIPVQNIQQTLNHPAETNEKLGVERERKKQRNAVPQERSTIILNLHTPISTDTHHP
ncbi:hypothetical protein PoB_001102500 [Plakobranchus ocellatus]|uniref:Uncharacterized protein n=1 Tax=Plakobranchus ocellatus TaxID=259542 RepID=A0AAV3YQ04_9GAST|nr:hypothetical protein PoB_001102500 [Plakobranchus ocellatus]